MRGRAVPTQQSVGSRLDAENPQGLKEENRKRDAFFLGLLDRFSLCLS